jgi:hypothetical protein
MVVGKCATPGNQARDRLKIPHHVNGGNPERRDAQRGQCRIASGIAFRAVAHVMGHTVDLDREFRGRAVEIEDIRTERMLAAKAHAFRSGAEMLPELHFGRGQVATEVPCAFYRPSRRRHFSPPPASLVPLPICDGEEKK